MSIQTAQVTPDESAYDLASRMLSDDETQREIISETLTAAEEGGITESGRTACGDGSRILGPQGRHPTSVNLSMCPFERGGAWHTHVTPDEVRDPNNSIPDMANVVYGLLDVSVVSGTRSSEAIVRADDPDAAREEFNDALGIQASSPKDVVDALMDGRIPDPADAAERVRSRLSSLFKRVRNGFSDLDAWANDVEYGMVSMQMYEHDAVAYSTYTSGAVHGYGNHMVQSFADATASTHQLADRVDVDIANVVLSTAIGTVVGRIVTRALFGD